jgi:hypothetical protein
MAESTEPTYRSLERRARVVLGAFGVYILVLAASAWVLLEDLRLIHHTLDTDERLLEQWELVENLSDLFALLELGLLLVLCISFLTWIYRAARNAQVFSPASMRWGPGWAIGGFFVPILGLWRPLQVVGDIWRASGADTAVEERGQPLGPIEPVVVAWWFVFVAWWIVTQIAERHYGRAEYLEDFVDAHHWGLTGLVVSGVGAALAMQVVRRTTKRQAERAAELGLDLPSARIV